MTKQAHNGGWSRSDLKNPHRHDDKARRVREMFSAIAKTYDLANHVLSLNLDRRWRQKAAQLADLQPGQSVLDLCCGTGDLAIAFARNQPGLKIITGVDFSELMLKPAVKKITRKLLQKHHDRYNTLKFNWLCSDAQQCPFVEAQFDRIGCAFGIRNLSHIDTGLKEMVRLLKPGGRAVILEFSMPRSRVLVWGYQCYFRLVLPLIGGIISGDRHLAYQYLADSVRTFDTAETMVGRLYDAGFDHVQTVALCGGIVIAYIADKQ